MLGDVVTLADTEEEVVVLGDTELEDETVGDVVTELLGDKVVDADVVIEVIPENV